MKMQKIYYCLIIAVVIGFGTATGKTLQDAGAEQAPAENDSPEVSQPTVETPSDHLVPVSGVLLEKGTRRALADIAIYVRASDGKTIAASLMTDAKGEFKCRLAPGKYTAIIAAVGYDKLEEEITIEAGYENSLALRLVPLTINPYEIVVRSKKRSSEVSDQQLSVEEVTEVPGNNRDVLASIRNLPGVANVSVFNGYGNGLVIRGTAQEDSLFTVDGHALGDYSITGGFYHFGGLESIIEPELIESVDYIAGGFSAEYGNALGGVIELNLKDPRTDRIGGYGNLGLLSTSFMLEGPVSDKDSFAVSFKKGFIGSYIRLVEDIDSDRDNDINFVQYPDYYDATAVFRHVFSKDNDLKVTMVGKNDSMEVKGDIDFVSERSSDRNRYEDRFITTIAEWDYNSDDFSSLLSPAITYSYIDTYLGDRAYHKQYFDTYDLSEKLEYRLNEAHRFKGGLRIKLINARIDSYSFAIPKEGELPNADYYEEMRLKKDFFFYYPSIYFMDQFQSGRFTLTPGLYTMYDSHNDKYLVDPRFSLIYQLTKATSLKAATGLYSKMPLYDECVAPWGTKGLKPEKSIHGVLGVEHRLTENISMDLQTYYKSFYDMAVRVDDTDPSRYANDGTGYAYGFEILLRHQMTDNFFGWISYAYSVARRKDGPDKDERYFDSDTPHILTAVASYKPNRYWSFGLRYQYASGNPYTDLTGVETLYEADRDVYYPLYSGSINEDRLKSHQQLDFRLDKYWIFNNFIMSTYLDVRNVFQYKNAFSRVYSKDFSQSEDALSIDSYVPLIFIGLKFDF